MIIVFKAEASQKDIDAVVDRLKQIPLWMACGTSDRFYPGNVELARSLPNARTVFDRGGHTTAYSRAHWGDGMAWLARQV